MRPGQLLHIGIVLTTFGSITLANVANSFPEIKEIKFSHPITVTTPVTTIAENPVAELMLGVFQTAEAPTTGNAKIMEKDGIRYLVIDSSFSTTDQAPDLHVLLDSAELPPQKYEEADSGRYINLGGIQNTMGEQQYPIPNSLDLDDIKSVVIWCRMANATIGFATLNDSATASIK